MTTAVGRACLVFVSIHVLMIVGILLLGIILDELLRRRESARARE